ncbi:MAG: DUF4301 family protein [Bacteroidales bacterium]
MFNPKDKELFKTKGLTEEAVLKQVEQMKKGFPFLEVIKAATLNDGIQKHDDQEINQLVSLYTKKAPLFNAAKFVPASGAATRMFKDLFNYLQDAGEEELVDIDNYKAVKKLITNIQFFAFADELKAVLRNDGFDLYDLIKREDYPTIIRYITGEEGLNYGNLPKGLILFHDNMGVKRVPVEEHMVEGIEYARSKDGKVKIHFTVSPEHLSKFKALVLAASQHYGEKTGAEFNITFSVQKESTDTIALTPDNEPFRNDDDSILFRPAGHGALLDNLQDVEGEIVFIKNIDNVVPDRHKQPTILYKKYLGGLLIDIMDKIFGYQKILDEKGFSDRVKIDEMLDFVRYELNTLSPSDLDLSKNDIAVSYLASRLFRPIRVCGMVKNEGEPGGGPFWAKNPDGSTSLQIVETSQINMDNPDQAAIHKSSTHFNPVDIVCSFKNYRGEKYKLHDFRDENTGFISKKSKDGRELKAMELPGLWNGSMSDWNSLFVEVPASTFNPVKTVNDLLRDIHR